MKIRVGHRTGTTLACASVLLGLGIPALRAADVAPNISVSPTAFSESLESGGNVTRTLRITNGGGSDLSFDLTVRGAAMASPPGIGVSSRLLPGEGGSSSFVHREPGQKDLASAPLAGTYTGAALAFGITSFGEVMPFQFPVGNEHLAVGSWYSGYTLAYVAGGFDHVVYALTYERSGITPVSYTEISNTPELAEVEVVTQTYDGVLKITQHFVFSKATNYLTVSAEIVNLLDTPVSDVVFKRSADWDVDGTYDSDSWDYDTGRNMVFAWEQNYVAMASVETPQSMDIDGWDDIKTRATNVDYPVGPVLRFDGNEILHFDLGTLDPGQSKAIHAVYGAGSSLLDLQQAIDRGRSLAQWLSLDPTTGTVPAGGYRDVQVTFDATGLIGGDYDAQLVVASNDPDQPEVTVPAHLHVTGVPDIALSRGTLDYGPVFIGTSSTRTVSVMNAGTDTLTVTSVAADNGDFTADVSSFALGAGQSRDLTITYRPTSAGPVAASLKIASNDPDEPSVTVSLSGQGVTPPDVAVSPASLSEGLYTGGSVTRALRITNTGGGDLSFQLRLLASSAAAQSSARADLFKPKPVPPTLPAGPYDADRPPTRGPLAPAQSPESGAPAPGFAVLILSCGADLSEISPLLQAFPDFSAVDALDACYVVPSAAQLTPYGAVIVVDSNPFSDPAGVGNVLADFVDRGGGVVLTVPSFIPSWSITGRFVSGGYMPLVNAYGPLGGSALGSFDASHPIMRGVVSAGGDLLAAANVAAGATLVASWSNGFPFVVTKGRQVAAINVYVGNPGYWTGDIPLILRNAALWSGGPRWLSVDAGSGVVPAGGYRDIQVTFDATGLVGGDYDAQIVVTSNDPDQPEITVPAHLHVTGVADIQVTPASLDYGPMFIGSSSTKTVTVSNAGTDTLSVTSVAADNGDFTADVSSFTLGVGQSRDLTITYRPSSPGPVAASLKIASNDPDESVVTVSLSGQGQIPPNIEVSPASLSESLYTGGSVTRTLRITNSGGIDLDFDLTIRGAAMASAPGIGASSRILPGEGGAGSSGFAHPEPGQKDAPFALLSATYTGANLAFGITDFGEVMPFQYPVGNEDLAVGSWYSGYTLAYRVGGSDRLGFALTYQRAGIAPVSYMEIRNTPDVAEVEVVTQTTDGALKLTQHFVFSKATKFFTVSAEIANLSDTPVSDVVFKRSADWDVDGTYNNDSWDYDRGRNMVVAWDQTYVAIAGVEAPQFMDIDGWNDITSRATIVDFPVGPVVRYDGMELLDFGLGTLGPRQSKTIHAVYGAGSSLSELQQSIDRGRSLATWLSFDQTTGTVPAGGYRDVQVIFNATGLYGGDYDAQIVVTSNDPDQPEITVPAHLHVTGVPDIQVTPGALDYGPTFVGTASTKTVTVTNAGTDTLSVTSVATDNGDFTADVSSFTLGVGQSRDLTITYQPSHPGPLAASLKIASNDPDESLVSVSLSGQGQIPPDVAVSPAAFSESLSTGGSVTRTLRITNSGGSDLSFQLALATVTEGRTPTTPIEARSDAAPKGAIEQPVVESRMSGADVLLVESVAPWGTHSNEQVLAGNGLAFDTIGAGSLASTDLTRYRLIIVASDQPPSFYSSLAAQLSRIETWVASGGVLEFHAASQGYQTGDTSILTLPRGLHMYQHQVGTNHVLDPAHPLVAGVPSVFTGNQASHSSFTNIPADASLVASDDVGQPNLVVYRDGLGFVIAGGQTFEWGVAHAQPAGQILMNMIPYAHGRRTAWLAVDSSSGVVPAGGYRDVQVTFDASGMSGGDYNAQIVVTSNDPNHSSVSVPSHLHVRCTGTPSQCEPVAACADVTVEADGHCAGHVTADQIGGASHDPNGRPLTLSLDPPAPYALGATPVTLTVTNDEGTSSTCTSTVRVVDVTAPELTVRLDPDTLWQPDHRMVGVHADVKASDNCGSVSIVLTAVVSSEADNGADDGDTIHDIADVEPGTPDFNFSLRAERSGSGPGRIYTAFYEARDGSGNVSAATGHTVVPHDQGTGDPVDIRIDETPDGSRVSWRPAAAASSYDVVRGRVASIRETDVVVDLGPVVCIARQTQGTSTSSPDFEIPGPGELFFYLVEYDNGTSASYGKGTTKPRVPGLGACN